MSVVILIKCPDTSIVDVPMLGSTVVIGRSSKADIKIDDPMISSRHCSVELRNGALIFKDLGSTNGSYLYNSQISSVQIKCGDQVRIGNTHIYIDESKLSAKEKIIFSHAGGKTEILYVKMKKAEEAEKEEDEKEALQGPIFADLDDNDQDVISRLEAKESKIKQQEIQNDQPEEARAEQIKKRPSVGANLAKKIIDNKKTAVSTVALSTKEPNFDQEAPSGQTKFIKLDKNKKKEDGPIAKRHVSKKKSETKMETQTLGLIGMLKKWLGF